MPVTIHGAGCALIDYLYNGVSFDSPQAQRLTRRSPGDGGLVIGGLVFADALERFARAPLDEIIGRLVGNRPPDRSAVGGPAIVSMIATAQLTHGIHLRFHGAVGADAGGTELRSVAAAAGIDVTWMHTSAGESPATFVLSDPAAAGGAGERLFIHRPGVAAESGPEALPRTFPEADIVQLGGTALVPRLHDHLPGLLTAAREAGALTIVNTVYDFRAEREAPGERWTLGDDDAYPLIDLLVSDAEEARALSGCAEPGQALGWFLGRGVGAAIITDGAAPLHYAAVGDRFAASFAGERPVFSGYAERPEVRDAGGDTTGCGDNFVGGVVASIASQMAAASTPRDAHLDLDAAVTLGIAAGAFCLTHLGGTYPESAPGEKRRAVELLVAELMSTDEAR